MSIARINAIRTRQDEIDDRQKGIEAEADEKYSGHFTEEMNAEYDTLTKEWTALSEELPSLLTQHRLAFGPDGSLVYARRSSVAQLPNNPGSSLMNPITPGAGFASGYVDSRTGEDVPVYGPGDRFGTGKKTTGIGQAIYAMMTGGDAQMSEGVVSYDNTQGGLLVRESTAAELLDAVRAASVAFRAGAQAMDMPTAEYTIVKQESDPVAQWRPEGTRVLASGITFSRFTLRAKTLAAIVPITLEALEDAANAPAVIENALRIALAAELDRAILMGAGTDAEPLGIINTPGIQSVANSPVGTPDNYTLVTSAVGKILQADYPGEVSSLSWVGHPRDFETYEGLVDTTGQPLNPTPWASKLKRFNTTKLPTNLGSGEDETFNLVGDFGQVLVGFRLNGVRLRVHDAGSVNVLPSGATIDNYDAADLESINALDELRRIFVAYMRADITVIRPQWMTKITGIQFG